MKNKKLFKAISALWMAKDATSKHSARYWLERSLACGMASRDDPWVAACLGCVNDEDIPDVALEFFLADCKSGVYDVMPIPDPSEA